MSQPSITNFIVKRPWLKRWMTPLANWYTDAAGYRKLGLRSVAAPAIAPEPDPDNY
jgi:ubiquinol-cytochrome c reductase subunit 7